VAVTDMSETTLSESMQTTGSAQEPWIASFVARTKRRRRNKRIEVWAERLLGLLAALGVWQALASFGIVQKILISNPELVGKDLGSWVTQSTFWVDLRVTIVQMLIGLAIGTALGVTIGLLVGIRPRLSKAVQPLTVAVHAVPIVVLFPLFLLWFGFGDFPKILIVTLSVFFVIFFNTLAGAGEINKDLIFGMRLMGCGTREIIRQVYLPSVVGWVIVALRTAVAYALVGAVVSEFLASTAGLGYELQYAAQFLNIPRVFSVLVVLAVLGMLLSGLVDLLEGWALRWR
jgi:NitT/TauT family transport system permease protein